MVSDLNDTAEPKGQRGRRLIKAAGIVAAATLASRLLGLLRETAVSAWFGSSPMTDAYTASFSLPDLMFFLIAGGAMSSSFIPVFTEYYKKGNEEEAWRFFSIIVTFMLIVLGALVVVGEIFAPQIVPLLAPGFNPEQLATTAHLTRIILPAQLAFFIGGLMMATLYVRGHFLVPALGPVIYNLGIILGGWLLGPKLGVYGLSWGALAGAWIGNFFLQLFVLMKLGLNYKPSLNLRHPGVVKAGKLVLPVLLGLSLPQVYSIVNRMFGSELIHGTVTNLDRANKLMQAPLGIFAQSISIALFPTMSALAAEGKMLGFRDTLQRGLRALWFISIPLSLLMMIVAPDIVSVILKYRKLGPEDAQMIAVALACYCTGLFAFSSQSILNRAFYAIQDTVTPVVVGTVTTIVFVGLNFALIHPFGYKGLALAGSMAAIIHVLWMMTALKLKAKVDLGPMPMHFAKYVGAAVLAAAAAWLARHEIVAFGPKGVLQEKAVALASIAAAFSIGGGVYIGAAHLMGFDEIGIIKETLKRRKSKSAITR